MATKKTDIDLVADILIRLKRDDKKFKVKQDEVAAAINAHNDTMEKMRDLEAKTKQVSGSSTYDKVWADNEKLKEKITLQEIQIRELNNRLSQIAGKKLTENNPEIADLSDAMRPTKLGEIFGQLYDNEWTNAFEELVKLKIDEEKVIDMLADIVEMAVSFCKTAENKQIGDMFVTIKSDITQPKTVTPDHKGTIVPSKQAEMPEQQEKALRRAVKDLRRPLAFLSIPGLVENFNTVFKKKLLKRIEVNDYPRGLHSFIEQCISTIWFMKIQDPPMVLLWQKRGEKCDKQRFSYYTRKGPFVAQLVWPAVLLTNEGPVVYKGVVQGIDSPQ